MKTKKTPFLLVLATLLIASFNVSAVEQQCATNVTSLLATPSYKTLNANLTTADVTALTNALKIVSGQSNYQTLLNLANSIAAGLRPNGRLVVTLPDGTVVVDTKKKNNSYANFEAKKINENHNSRIAILDAQLWPCGLGVETRFSTSTGATESYVAKRLGNYLNNYGTARINN